MRRMESRAFIGVDGAAAGAAGRAGGAGSGVTVVLAPAQPARRRTMASHDRRVRVVGPRRLNPSQATGGSQYGGRISAAARAPLVAKADPRLHDDRGQGKRGGARHFDPDAHRGHPRRIGGRRAGAIEVGELEPGHALGEGLGSPARLAPEHRAAKQIRDSLPGGIDDAVLVEVTLQRDARGLRHQDGLEARALGIVAGVAQLAAHALQRDAGRLGGLGARRAHRMGGLAGEEQGHRGRHDQAGHGHGHQQLDEGEAPLAAERARHERKRGRRRRPRQCPARETRRNGYAYQSRIGLGGSVE
jgi:hypothetical protein